MWENNRFFSPVLVLTLENPELDHKNRSLRFRFGFGEISELDQRSGSGFGENYP
jgi:hypothetical protein